MYPLHGRFSLQLPAPHFANPVMLLAINHPKYPTLTLRSKNGAHTSPKTKVKREQNFQCPQCVKVKQRPFGKTENFISKKNQMQHKTKHTQE
jgi:hypothetical protein